jgi:hypothetical protein
MLRGAEFGLFLLPFALYGVWLVLGRQLSARFMWIGLTSVGVLSAGVLWYGLTRGLPAGERYVPAHVENGRIVQPR